MMDDKQMSFVSALKATTKREVSVEKLHTLVDALCFNLTAVKSMREGLNIFRQDIVTLERIQRTFTNELKAVPQDARIRIVTQLNEIIHELQTEVDFEDADRMTQFGSTDTRVEYTKIIRIYAEPVRDYLVESEIADSDFWTAGVMIVMGKLPLDCIRMNSLVKQEIENVPFEKLNTRKGGAGWYIKDYIRRLLK